MQTQCDTDLESLLASWRSVFDRCVSDITDSSGVHVAYEDGSGNLRELPQLSTMKQASAEIRAISKQLGESGSECADKKPTILDIIRDRRDIA